MYRRLNQYAFAVFIFTLQATFTATLSYAFVLFIFLLGWQKEKIDLSMILGSGAYVFMFSMPCCLLAFLLSIAFKKSLKRLPLKKESYLILTIAALPAVGISIAILRTAISELNFVIYAATLLSIYTAAFFYRSTWNTLDLLKAGTT